MSTDFHLSAATSDERLTAIASNAVVAAICLLVASFDIIPRAYTTLVCYNTMQTVSRHYGMQFLQIRLWPCDLRDNKTVRPDTPLQGEDLRKTVQQLVSAHVAQ
jgi:hypothetical protein